MIFEAGSAGNGFGVNDNVARPRQPTGDFVDPNAYGASVVRQDGIYGLGYESYFHRFLLSSSRRRDGITGAFEARPTTRFKPPWGLVSEQ